MEVRVKKTPAIQRTIVYFMNTNPSSISPHYSKIGSGILILLFSSLIIFLALLQVRQLHESSIYGDSEYRLLAIYLLQFFSLGFVIQSIYKKTFLRISLLEVYIALYPFLTIPILIFNDVNYSFKYVVTDLAMPIVFILVISLFRSVEVNFKSKILKFSIWFYFIIFILTILIANNIELSYYSIASIQIAFVFSYFLAKNQHLKVLLLFLFIFYSGKRGVFIGILASIFAWVLNKKKLTLLFLILTLLALYFFFNEYIDILSTKGVFQKTNFIYDDSERFFENFLGPRYYEIKGSLEHMIENPYLFISGNGIGFFYYQEHSSGGVISSHNVHFSPVGFLTTYGAPYTLALYYYLLKNLKKSIIAIKTSKDEFKIIFGLYFIAAFVNSFTVYSVFVDVLFAISIGVLQNRKSAIS
jgi:hypothetical protein